jgi:hypothetical protein
MKRTVIALAAFTGGILAISCSEVPGPPRFNMDYSTEEAGLPQYIYIFTAASVNVFDQGVPIGDGTTVTNATSPYDHVIRIPILENASYTINGFTLTIDWSKHKPNYFPLSASKNTADASAKAQGATAETFTLENTGLILRSTTDTNLYLSEQS